MARAACSAPRRVRRSSVSWRVLLISWPLFALLSLKLQPAGAFTPVRPVLAWYRGWYAEPRNWKRTADLPPELSNSYDDATMRRPIRQVRAVGVPGFTCTCRHHCEQLFDITAAMIIAG